MTTKADIADKIGEHTGDRPDPDKHTVDELRAMLAEASEPKKEAGESAALAALREPGGVTRRKVNRGSTRRMNRALMAAQRALTEFAKEIDIQVYVTNDKGDRIDEVPLVAEIREFSASLSGKVAEFTTPIDEPKKKKK